MDNMQDWQNWTWVYKKEEEFNDEKQQNRR